MLLWFFRSPKFWILTMGRRSNFLRREMDVYDTIDPRAVSALFPYLIGVQRFAEPCGGKGCLVSWLRKAGLECFYCNDIMTGVDA